MLSVQQKVQEAADAVRLAWQAHDDCLEWAPEIIITTGSGLGSITQMLSPLAFEMSYGAIPHVPASGVAGHAGRLLIGQSAGKKVLVLDGRIHGYEGHDPLTQVLPLLIAKQLCEVSKGTPLAVFTNAAGAINEGYRIGQLMLIKDHINFTGQTVVGFDEASNFGGSNLDMTFAYAPALRDLAKEVACKEGINLAEGIYLGVKGAMFETPAEICAFRTWGADAVGMSTVHEATAASRLGMPVMGISVITNMAAGIEAKKLTHQEVLENTVDAAQEVITLIQGLLQKLP